MRHFFKKVSNKCDTPKSGLNLTLPRDVEEMNATPLILLF